MLAPLDPEVPDIDRLGRVLFTDYVFAFEMTAVLLTIAVVGAVVLTRRAGAPIDLDEFPEGTMASVLAERAARESADEDADGDRRTDRRRRRRRGRRGPATEGER